MAAKANPKLVGGFVVGAAALLVVVVALFGGGNLLASHPRGGTYFRGSVAGLMVGAPVTYQGVQVGQVRSIRLEVDNQTLDTRMPVEFEFLRGTVSWSDRPLNPGEYMRLVEKGLRAKLVAQSLVTGLLAIELGYYPDSPAALVGGLPGGVMEIPSVQSDLETLKATLEELPLSQIAASVLRVLGRLDGLLGAPELKDTMVALNAGLERFKDLMRTTDDRAGPMMDDIRRVTAEAGAAMAALRESVTVLSGEVRPLSARVQEAATAAERAARQAESTLRTVDGALDPRSPMRGNLEQTVASLAAAARSLRSFADQIDRRPNVIITGR